MDEWWKTPPSLVGPPAVNPAIYGIDHTDVGLDEYVGLSGAASAQAGASMLTRADHMRAGEGGRAATMSTQLMLAARKIETSTKQILDTLKTPLGERSPDGVMTHLEALVKEAVKERDDVMFVVHEQQRSPLKVAPVQEGISQIDRASHQLTDAVLKVKDFASRHQLPFDATKTTGDGVSGDVERLEKAMQIEVDSSDVKPVQQSEAGLQLESLRESLQALDGHTQALVLAVNEATPDQKVREVLPSLFSSTRMLQKSLVVGLHPSKDMMETGTRIRFAIKKAWKDAEPFGIQTDSSFKQAFENIPPMIDTLQSLDKGKKK